MAESASLEEQLYYGSVEVRFESVPGKFFDISTKTMIEIKNNVSEKIARSRSEPLKISTEEHSLVMPVIPAIDIVVQDIENENPTKIPTLLQLPLLKSETGSIIGYQSGRRSALIKVNNEWYRLKGCGDLYEGFPLKSVEGFPGSLQIRGCCFEYLSIRELFYSHVINESLTGTKVSVCNSPKGWWEYELKESSYPDVKRTCLVTKTLGNRRLGDNLITGIERLLPYIVDLDTAALLGRFPADRFDSDKVLPSNLTGVFETFMVTLTGDFGCEQNLMDFELNEKAPLDYKEVDEKWRPIWNQSCETLKNIKDLKTQYKTSSILFYLFWRIGRECSSILKAMHSCPDPISWGTYTDKLGSHCNAHINNLVILTKNSNQEGFLLSPLDYDMAFRHSSYIESQEKWTDTLELEKNALKMVLAGDPSLNTGVTATSQLSLEFEQLKWALRDTLVVSYNLASEKDLHPVIPELEDVVYAFINLALIVTEAEVA
jgi:hypothetical protein